MIRVLSISCGLLMVAAVGIGTHGQTLVAAVLAAAAVVAGTVFRPAATLAVLLTVAAVVLANPAPTVAAVSGLAAAGAPPRHRPRYGERREHPWRRGLYARRFGRHRLPAGIAVVAAGGAAGHLGDLRGSDSSVHG